MLYILKKTVLSRSHLTTCHSWPMAQSILETLFKQQQMNLGFLCKAMYFGWIPTHICYKKNSKLIACAILGGAYIKHSLQIHYSYYEEKSTNVYTQAFCCCFICFC